MEPRRAGDQPEDDVVVERLEAVLESYLRK